MAKLEIDKEDVHDRKKWRMNVMKRNNDSTLIINYFFQDYLYKNITYSSMAQLIARWVF